MLHAYRATVKILRISTLVWGSRQICYPSGVRQRKQLPDFARILKRFAGSSLGRSRTQDFHFNRSQECAANVFFRPILDTLASLSLRKRLLFVQGSCA